MADTLDAQDFRERLLAEGLLSSTDVDGVYHLSARFEKVVRGVGDLVHRSGSDGSAHDSELVFLPPVTPRDAFVRSGYLRSFPDLTGSVEAFRGGEGEHAELLRIADAGGDWTRMLSPTEVVLASAACHALYPRLSGRLPATGRWFEVEAWCFRHEPSKDPTRMQSFRMREFVFAGEPRDALAHRDLWLDRGVGVLTRLGLPAQACLANDPFFGRAGRLLAASQRDDALKHEIVTPIGSAESPTAIASANYHQDHFGRPFGILTARGDVAHSACFGFGLERIALALLHTHGLDPKRWPAAVSRQLWP